MSRSAWDFVRDAVGGELPSRYLALADRPGEDAERKLKHRFLILAGTMMSGGGLLWGSIAAGAGLYNESLVPYGYVVVTSVNFAILAKWKNFAFARTVQVTASILLPFAFQWVLGGFGASGGMMYWGMIGVIGSLSFEDLNKTFRWISTFVVLTIISAAADGMSLLTVPEQLQNDSLSALFFGLNFVVVSGMVFSLTLFFVKARHDAMLNLEVINDELAKSNAEAESASRRADAANEARGRFLAVVSHEMRTPLNGILGLTNLALDTDLSPRQLEMLRQVVMSGETLLAIINDVLDFSKIEAGGIQLESIPFRLDDVLYRLSSTARSLAMKRGVEFVLHVEDVPPVLIGDPTRLGQILLNLVSNAIKFTEDGEVVVHLTGERTDDEVQLSVSVRDTGVGISAADQRRLFEPFQQADDSTTRRYGGTGLGLPICKHFVELMGGEITVTSEPGKGSTFSFTVAHGYEPETPLAMPAALGEVRTLIVDDNDSARAVLLGYLGNFGIAADAVETAEEALEKVAQTPYGLVLTDLRMPGMNGIELIRKLRAEPTMTESRLVLVTAVGGKRDREEAESAGADGFLTKPVRSSTLLDHLMQMFTPELAPNQRTASERRERSFPGLRGKRVLVVEDNDINREILVDALDAHHAESVVAIDGVEGVREARERLGALDGILMDLQMPNMDGLEASRLIRAFDPQIPIIGVTANALSEARSQCLEAGMDDVITKPVHMNLLLSTLQRLIAGADEVREDTGEMPALRKRATKANVAGPLSDIGGLDTTDGLTRAGGNADLYEDLLRRFASAHGDAAGRIRDLVAEDKREDAGRIAHTLKGVAGNIGATEVYQLASKFRGVFKGADAAEMQNLLNQLDGVLTQLVRDLETALEPEPLALSIDGDGVQRLREFVMESDPEAVEAFRAVRGHITRSWGDEAVAEMSRALDDYDFDAAQQILARVDGGPA